MSPIQIKVTERNRETLTELTRIAQTPGVQGFKFDEAAWEDLHLDLTGLPLVANGESFTLLGLPVRIIERP